VLRVLLLVLVLAVYIYALVDLATAPSDEVRLLPRPVWLLVVLLVPVAGPLGWLWLGRPSTGDGGDGGGGGGGLRERFPFGGGGGTDYASGPVAPDDDPDFLRGLDEQRRRAGDD